MDLRVAESEVAVRIFSSTLSVDINGKNSSRLVAGSYYELATIGSKRSYLYTTNTKSIRRCTPTTTN